jgi:hypothetical protein
VRYLAEPLARALAEERRMAFVAGPRQVGKTTLARHLLAARRCQALYFNWDIDADRRAIVEDPAAFFVPRLPLDVDRPTVAFDEIHKYPRWKRFLKGFFDRHAGALATLVTGSGRLDVYQRGGDSLLGRYDLYRLHPFTTGELVADGRQYLSAPDAFVTGVLTEPPPDAAAEALDRIERFTGFPEPLFAGRIERLRRWRRSRQSLVLREDLRDLTHIRELGLVESLVLLLPERVGSPLSLNALALHLGVAFNTVKAWLEALARLYFCFQLRPWAGRLSRTLRREEKLYLFDSTSIPDPGPRFENVVALHLRKLTDFWTDLGLGDFDLWYVRDKEKREVDFLVTEGRRPWLLVEAKLSDATPAPALRYFQQRLQPAAGALQVVRNLAGGPRVHLDGPTVVSAAWALAKM